MSQLGVGAVFLLVGLGLLALLFARASRRMETQAPAKSAAKEDYMLSRSQGVLPSRLLAERIFSPQDWDFVSQQTSLAIQRNFVQERKTMAISWLSQTRSHVAEVMRSHRHAARGMDTMNPMTEFRLALDFALFLFSYELLSGLIRLRGPFAARRVVVFAATMADQLSVASEQVLAGMKTPEPGAVKSGS